LSDNLYARLARGFALDPDAPFIDTDAGEHYTYAEMDRITAVWAGFLAGPNGLALAPGERVAVQVEKSPQALFLYLACLRAGLVYLPLNVAYREGEMRHFTADASPLCLVADPAALSWLRPMAEASGVRHVFTLDESGAGTFAHAAQSAGQMAGIVDRHADDLAAILYTSGTTGRAKGAMISHRNLFANASTLHRLWGFTPEDRLLHVLPLFHVHGLFVACNTTLLNGTSMRFCRRFDASAAIADFSQVTLFMGVPTHYTRLLQEPTLSKDACRGMRLFISGSAPLLSETFDQFRQRTGHTILERYGMTETGMITSNPLHGERRGGTVGPPLPGVALRVVDDADRPLPPGSIGHLQVKGDNVLCGYWRLPERNAQEFTVDGYFRTGDIGRQSADGYVTLVGRAKDLIISGGFNVYPKEVELALDALPGVRESAVIGVPHPDYGEAVTAVVVGDPRALEEPALIAQMKATLASFKVPKRVFIVDDLPRNTMGKVQKNLLRERYRGVYEQIG
jgi:malonyl-CoA/methylmalonyl-CoA synthetase